MSPQEAERLIQNSGTTLYLDIERLVTIENQLDFDNMEMEYNYNKKDNLLPINKQC